MKSNQNKKLYDLIKEDESFFSTIQEGLLEGLQTWRIDSPIHQWINPRILLFLGYAPSQISFLSNAILDIINPHDLQLALQSFKKHLENETHPYDQEIRFTHSNGNIVWIRSRGFASRNANGKPEKMFGFHQDITELKKLQQKLELKEEATNKKEQIFISIFEQSPLAIQIYDQDGKLTNANHQTLTLFGIKNKSEIIGFNLWDDPNLTAEYRKELKAGKTIKVPATFNPTPENPSNAIYVENFVLPIYNKNKVTGYLVQVTNITENKLVQDELIHNEKKFRSIFDNSNIAMMLCTPYGIITEINNQFLNLTGYTQKDLINTAYKNIPSFKVFENEIEKLKQLIKKEINNYRLEKCLIKKNGNPIWLDIVITARQNDEGRTDMLIIMASDISESKKSEAILKNMLNELQVIYDHNPSYTYLKDTKNNILKISNTAAKAIGLTKEQIEGKNASEIYPIMADEYYKSDLEVINSGKAKLNYLNTLHNKFGEVRWTITNKIPIKENGKDVSGILVVSTDITELKLNEEKLNVAIEGANLGTWELNLKTNEIYTNKYWLDHLGYEQDEVTLKLDWWYSIMHPDDVEYCKDLMIQHLEGKTDIYRAEIRVKNKAGQWVWVHERGKVVSRNIKNKPILVSGIHADITKRKNNEQKLLKQNHDLKKAIEKAEAGEKTFKQLFYEHSAIKFIICKDSGKIYDANPAAANFYGWSIDELKKMKISDLNLLSASEIKNVMDKVSNKEKLHFEFKHKKADGSIADIEVYSSNILIDNKSYFYSIVHDITEKKKQEQHIKLLGKSVEQSPVAIFITNKNGIIEYINPAFTKITGYTYIDIQNSSPNILNSGSHSQAFYNNLWNTIKNNKKWTGEIQNKRKDGTLYWCSLAISPIVNENNEIINFVAASEDITHKKTMVDDLILAKEKAEEANKLKTEFLNNISHEIRTPVNGIVNFSEFLNEPNLDTEKRIHYASILKNSSKQLLNIIDDILEISTLKTEKVKVVNQPFNLNSFMLDMYAIYSVKSKETNIPFNLNKPNSKDIIYINSDKSRLQKALKHILNNAFKFTHNGYIELSYTISNNAVSFYIKDTGIGIESKHTNSIFNRFVQENKSIAQNYGGLGLGLSIAKENAELVGATISIKSAKGTGTTFCINLPTSVEIDKNPHDSSKNIISQIEKDNVNILIVEDENLNFIILKKLLLKTHQNFNIMHALNGQEAVDLCNNQTIDLIFMDMNMPVKNGYNATKEIKLNHPKTPIIAQSAYTLDNDIKKAFDAGVDDFLAKPIDKKLLYKILNKYVKIKS